MGVGLVPATISPFVIAAIGQRQARRLFITAAAFSASEAEAIGLLHLVVPPEKLDAAIEETTAMILQNGPLATREAKRLVRTIVGTDHRDVVQEETSQLLAKLRASDEGKEGLSAFLEKRKPKWTD